MSPSTAFGEESVDAPRTIALLSLIKESPENAWQRGEARILEELEISEYDVTVVDADPAQYSNRETWFQTIAKEHHVATVIMVENKGETNIVLSLFSTNAAVDKKIFQKISFDTVGYENNNGYDEIVALKTVAAVRAAVLTLSDTQPEPPAPVPTTVAVSATSPDTNKPFLRIAKRSAVGLLVAGGLTLVTAGALHGASYYNIVKANEIAQWTIDHSNADPSFEKNKESYTSHVRVARKLQVGMIVSYVVGGVLAASGTAVFLWVEKKKKKKSMTVTLTGAGVVVAF